MPDDNYSLLRQALLKRAIAKDIELPDDGFRIQPGRWDLREDGSKKGNGFLGLQRRPDGMVSSEISSGNLINGKEVEFPTMVPGLTPQEFNFLLRMKMGSDIPDSIIDKAKAHAIKRMANGQSVFANPGEEQGPPPGTAVSAAGDITLPNEQVTLSRLAQERRRKR